MCLKVCLLVTQSSVGADKGAAGMQQAIQLGDIGAELDRWSRCSATLRAAVSVTRPFFQDQEKYSRPVHGFLTDYAVNSSSCSSDRSTITPLLELHTGSAH